MKKLRLVAALMAVLAPLTLKGQILQYRFSGTVEGNHPDLDFFAEELELSDSTIRFGDTISGVITVDPVDGDTINAPGFPPGNEIYGQALLDAEVEINGEPFLANQRKWAGDIGVFNNASTDPGGLEYPLGDERADAVIFVFFVGIERVGKPEERFLFMLNFTDTSAEALGRAKYPDSVDVAQYDLTKGFIRPSSEEGPRINNGVMFQIDSFELIGTQVRPVIARGPVSQTVKEGDSIRLTMSEVRGNSGVECQWSLNGVDLPGETLPGLSLDNMQPSDAGTYRVTAWNNLGTTNVAAARIIVEGNRHRMSPLELSGWNADVIVEADEDLTNQIPFDGDAAYWFAADFPEHPDGFPLTGGFTSAGNAGVRYELQPYDARNALWLEDSDAGEVLTLTRPKQFTSLALIAASVGGNDDEEGMLVLHFADGSTSEGIAFRANDWWTTPERSAGAAIAGLGRLKGAVDQSPEYESPEGYGFGLYETELDLVSLGLANKPIAWIEFRKPLSSSATGIFGVSGQSAELRRGFHVSWPSEGEKELFEVAVSPDGPWISYGSEVQTIEARNYATVDSAGLPRYSRSSLRHLERDLYAHYDFSVDGRDRVGSGQAINFGLEGELVDQTQFIAKKPFNSAAADFAPGAVVPRLTYLRYTLGLDFYPLEVSPDGKQTILNGGINNRWIQLYTDNGRLVLSFDNGEFVTVFEDTDVLPARWHRVLCAVDIRTGFVNLVFDGKPLPSLDLGERYRYQTNPSTTSDWRRTLNFAGSNEMAGFVGNIDNLMLFRVGYTDEQLVQIHQALEPSRLALEFVASEAMEDGYSVGMNLGWESNLEGFELQRAVSPVGPWTSVEPLRAEFNEKLLYPMLMDGQFEIFRLWKAR